MKFSIPNHKKKKKWHVVSDTLPAQLDNEFFKKNEKIDFKAGLLAEKVLAKEEIIALSKLPGLESLRAQLLGLLAQPATGFVRVLGAAPQSLVNVLQAKVKAENG